MPEASLKLEEGWSYTAIPTLSLGINEDDDPSLLDPSFLAKAVNLQGRRLRVSTEAGYKKFLGVVRGKPRRSYRFKKANGTTEQLLITNLTLYKEISSEWAYVSNGTSTTLTANAIATATSLTVASITGFASGEHIGITLDTGKQHRTTINGAPSGTTIVITDAMPSLATSGNAIVEAVLLAGSDNSQISVDTIAAQDWVVFTNGVDVVQKYDGTSVGALGGLSAINVTTAKALATYHSYLLLFYTTESAVDKPQRVRWCDTGAYETWSGGNASFEDLLTTPDFIRGASVLGPYLIIYRESSIVRTELISQPDNTFDFNTAVRGEGAASHDAIVVAGDSHVVWGSRGVYEYKGGFDVTYLSNNIHSNIFGEDSELDPSYKTRVFGRYLRELDEVYFFYVRSGQTFCDRALKYQRRNKSWWRRELPETMSGAGFRLSDSSKTWLDLVGNWTAQDFAWNSNNLLANAPILLLCGELDLQVFEYDLVNPTDDGGAIAWELQTKDFHHPHEEFTVDMLEFVAKGASVVVEYSMDRGASWNTYKTVTLTSTLEKYQAFGQFTTDRVRWKFNGTGTGFSLSRVGFAFEFTGPHNLS